MTEAILAAELSKSFGPLPVLKRLSLAVHQGEIFGLVGPDGAGKTTTMRLLTGILEPTSGDAWVCGCHIAREAEEIKRRIGYMSQRFGLYPDLTVMENIHFYGDIYGVPRKRRAGTIEQLLDFSGLAPFGKRLAGNLSGGMKQKLGLTCALIHNPEVLFLDEPTNGVDPVSRRDFWQILYELHRQKVTIFLSTAYLDEAERCNRLALVHQGNLLACDTPEEIRRMMPAQVLAMRCSSNRNAVALLRKEFGDLAASLFGDRIHLTASDTENARRQAEDLLRLNGIEVMDSRIVEPGLEDVFVAILSGNNGGRAHGIVS